MRLLVMVMKSSDTPACACWSLMDCFSASSSTSVHHTYWLVVMGMPNTLTVIVTSQQCDALGSLSQDINMAAESSTAQEMISFFIMVMFSVIIVRVRGDGV